MKALSIKQPWLDAILYGGKNPENRSWAIPADMLGVRILLHSSAAPDRTARPGHEVPRELTDHMLTWPGVRGAILGLATLAGCHFDAGCCPVWGQRQVFHWQLTGVAPLATPVPAKGRLKFWTPTEDVLAAIELPEVTW